MYIHYEYNLALLLVTGTRLGAEQDLRQFHRRPYQRRGRLVLMTQMSVINERTFKHY